jgi:hypothetical protein
MPVSGQRQTIEEFSEWEHEPVESLHAFGKSLTNLFSLSFGFSIEQRLADDRMLAYRAMRSR